MVYEVYDIVLATKTPGLPHFALGRFPKAADQRSWGYGSVVDALMMPWDSMAINQKNAYGDANQIP